jgi:large subunit ribosomal protein L9
VSGRDVADAVNAEGGKVERSMVVLDRPIKTLGLHEVKVRLHPEVAVTVTLNIARSQDEAERQARGEDVINTHFEEERVAAEQAAAALLEGGAGQIAEGFTEA